MIKSIKGRTGSFWAVSIQAILLPRTQTRVPSRRDAMPGQFCGFPQSTFGGADPTDFIGSFLDDLSALWMHAVGGPLSLDTIGDLINLTGSAVAVASAIYFWLMSASGLGGSPNPSRLACS